MTEFYGPYTRFNGPYTAAWKELRQRIEHVGLKDVHITQTGPEIGEIKYTPSIPEYSAAAQAHLEIGVWITKTSPPQYTIIITMNNRPSVLEFGGMDSENAIRLVQRLLTGQSGTVQFTFTNIT